MIQSKGRLDKEGLERRGNLRQGRPYHNTEIFSDAASKVKNCRLRRRSLTTRLLIGVGNTAKTRNPKSPLSLRQNHRVTVPFVPDTVSTPPDETKRT